MRITEAAARLGLSPRMLRYREDPGLLPPLRDRPTGRGQAHRQFTDEDMAAIITALRIEQQYDITPAALAFGLRVLTDPAARAAVADLGRRTGHVLVGELPVRLAAPGGPVPQRRQQPEILPVAKHPGGQAEPRGGFGDAHDG